MSDPLTTHRTTTQHPHHPEQQVLSIHLTFLRWEFTVSGKGSLGLSILPLGFRGILAKGTKSTKEEEKEEEKEKKKKKQERKNKGDKKKEGKKRREKEEKDREKYERRKNKVKHYFRTSSCIARTHTHTQ